MKITLVILTHNEISGLRAVGPRIPKDAIDEILAVDFRSTDGTRQYLDTLGFRVIDQEIPGRGEAFRLAVEHATGDALIFFSPDGNEDTADIPKFRSYFEKGNEVVIATRMVRGAHNEEDDHWWRLRKWVNLAFTLIANVLWNRSGAYVTDTINGFRGVLKKTFNELTLDGPGYTVEYQMSIRSFKTRRRIVEFPTYEGKRIGEGGAPGLPTGIVFVKLLLREMWLSVRGTFRKVSSYTPHSL